MKKFILSTAMLAGVFAMAQNTGIGTTNPTEKLEVAGNIKSTTINANAGATTDKVVVADPSGVLKTIDRTAGVDANAWRLTGNTITAGQFLGTVNKEDLVFKRNNILSGAVEEWNTSLGYNVGKSDKNAANIAIGSSVLNAVASNGWYNTGIGAYALSLNTSGSNNVALGTNSMYQNTTGTYNTALGYQTLAGIKTGNNNTVVGAESGGNVVGNNNILFGYNVGTPAATDNSLNIGNSIYGLNINDNNATNDLIGLGTTTPATLLDVNGQITSRTINTNTGAATDKVVVADTNGVLKSVNRAGVDTNAWQLTGNAITAGQFLGTTNDQDLDFKRSGIFSGRINKSMYNTSFGYNSYASLNGEQNTFFGYQAGKGGGNTHQNTAVGSYAMASGIGANNVAVGDHAMEKMNYGIQNVSVGSGAGYNMSDARYNVAIGYGAMAGTTTASKNIGIGQRALESVSGNSNLGIGVNAYIPVNADSYQMSIGNSIFGKNINNGQMQIGQGGTISPQDNIPDTNLKLDDDLVGVATMYPTQTLDVAGNIKIRGKSLSVSEGVACTDSGTITYAADGNFYGCTGAGLWKRLNN